MAVFTQIGRNVLIKFLENYDIGKLVSFWPSNHGNRNTVILLNCEKGKFALTLFEANAKLKEVSNSVALMSYLASRDFECAAPVPNTSGKELSSLLGKPALLSTFVEGDQLKERTTLHCRIVGETCARLHIAAREFKIGFENSLSAAFLLRRYMPLKEQLRRIAPDISELIVDEINWLEKMWPTGLPRGIIHGDLNATNMHFAEYRLTGVFDFQHAREDFLAFEIASAINCWCIRLKDGFDRELAAALIEGYNSVRKLDENEALALPLLARIVGMQWFVRRLERWFDGYETKVFGIKDFNEFRTAPDMKRFLKVVLMPKTL